MKFQFFSFQLEGPWLDVLHTLDRMTHEYRTNADSIPIARRLTLEAKELFHARFNQQFESDLEVCCDD